MSIRQAQREIDSREFAEWMAFFRLEPFGREAEDRPAALVASTIANVKRSKHRKAYTLDDFTLRYDRQVRQTWQEQKKILRSITTALGGTVNGHTRKS